VESQLGDAEVSSLQTGVGVRKGHNFGPDRWISLKILQEFPNTFFLAVPVESLLDDAEVSSLETRVRVRKGHNFGSDRWISIKYIHEFFRTPFI
jgi:hypothetical protein